MTQYLQKNCNEFNHTIMCKFSKPNYILIITLLLIGVCQIHAARSIRSNASDRKKTQEEKLQKSTRSGTIDRNERLQATNSDQENSILWERLLRDNGSFPSPPTRPPSSPTTPPAPTPFPPTVPPSPGPPTFPPTFRPTDSPRPPSDGILCGIPIELRSQLLTDMAEQISGTIVQGTPQSRALNWLINQDTYIVCPDDPKAYQRYILALFYFSTDGDNWEECSAPLRFDDPASIDEANDNCSVTTTPIPGGDRNPAFLPTTEGTDAWLTPVYECEWAGITCRVEGECVDRIEFGKKKVKNTEECTTYDQCECCFDPIISFLEEHMYLTSTNHGSRSLFSSLTLHLHYRGEWGWR